MFLRARKTFIKIVRKNWKKDLKEKLDRRMRRVERKGRF